MTKLSDGQPDWSESETGPGALWKNRLRPMAENLEVADGAIAFRDKVIANLRQQLAEAEAKAKSQYLVNGARFKLTLTANDCKLTGLPRVLGGRWVALVAADDDCHLKPTAAA